MSKLENLTLRQVGIVKSSLKKISIRVDSQSKDLKLDEMIALRQELAMSTAEIVVEEEYEECLDGIEEFSHVVICFLTDMPESARRIKKVHPGGDKEVPLKGIFACRSPARPNPLGLSTVKLLERKKTVLVVQGFDAVDGTVVLDIKPHILSFDAPHNVKMAQWVYDWVAAWEERMNKYKEKH